MAKKTECGNCGRVTATYRPLDETPDLNERLDPGSTVPAGECLKCGAFVYYLKPVVGPDPVLIEGGVSTELYAVEGKGGRIIAYCPRVKDAERVIEALS